MLVQQSSDDFNSSTVYVAAVHWDWIRASIYSAAVSDDLSYASDSACHIRVCCSALGALRLTSAV